METKDLTYLLAYEIETLYSAEEQMIEALPQIIAKATDLFLKRALQEHLVLTGKQVKRLDEARKLLAAAEKDSAAEKPSAVGSKRHAEGITGLIAESEKMMKENLSPEVADAAIIGQVQKIEHYEICGYGTAAAHAHTLGLAAIAALLQETLAEEYEADERLNDLALGGLNEEAEGTEADDWMHAGRPTSAELSKALPSPKNKKSPSGAGSKSSGTPAEKKSVSPKGKASGKATGKTTTGATPKSSGKAKAKRPSAAIPSPGGRAGTSYREKRGH